ncbi:hypothetical protein ElyMa_002256400 [Elysia marginata]|uniref:Uncharacterized protein n=1 Tax=Elysia marginata TaxID=1093978 RepID=A0AAV4FYP3_9GAST|nr:hypothetical protein ElyMa_002256400 [Elysia marginata]
MVSLSSEVFQVLSVLMSVFLSRVHGTSMFPHDRCLLQSTSVPITRSAVVEWDGQTVNAVCTGVVVLKKCEGSSSSSSSIIVIIIIISSSIIIIVIIIIIIITRHKIALR